MYSIALCDDDEDFLRSFGKRLSGAMESRGLPFRLSSFRNPRALQGAVEAGEQFDLAFLDVMFGKAEGLRLAETMRREKWETDIVFVTSSPEFAVESYDSAPLHYLVKPVAPEKLDVALERFLRRHAPDLIHFSTARGTLQMRVSDIRYFEIYGHEIVIHKTDGNKESCTGTLKELETALPPMRFVRPHRSYLVNLEHVGKIVRYQIVLTDGTAIPVSKKLYQKTQDEFIEYADGACHTLTL